MGAPLSTLQLAAERSRPVTTADTRVVDVPGALAPLLPDGGLRRGGTVLIEPGAGGTSIALALAGAATRKGAWAAALGLPSLGLVAAAELGVRLDRLALVPRPERHWALVAAALIDGVEMLLLGPPQAGVVGSRDARRLAARARERGAVMIALGWRWPEPPDLRIAVTGSEWDGLGLGHGCLRGRRMEVSVCGRRAAGRERRASLRLY